MLWFTANANAFFWPVLHGYNVLHGKPSDFATMGIPSATRYIHATGFPPLLLLLHTQPTNCLFELIVWWYLSYSISYYYYYYHYYLFIYLFIKDLDNQLVFVSSLCSVILLYVTRDLLFHWTELLWNSGCSSECQSRWNQEGFSCGNVFFGHLVSIFWASLMAWKRIFWVMVFSFLFLFCFCNFHIASLHVKNFVICCDWAIFWVSYSLHYFQETFVFGYISAIKNFIAALKVS